MASPSSLFIPRGAVERPRKSFSVSHVVGVCLPDESPSSVMDSQTPNQPI
uniref:Uncharacterized protein n=1 Tax=Cucumis melo TaxID=3656 RepID=A0A9I9CEA8_CUCME